MKERAHQPAVGRQSAYGRFRPLPDVDDGWRSGCLISRILMKTFDLYARVYVAGSGGWKATFLGTICSEAEQVQTVKGPENYYWVEFDEPQEDVSGLTFIGRPKF